MATTCSPLIATGSGSDLGYQEEVCAGKLPADPELKVFPRVSTSLALSKEAYQSEQIRSDRQVSDSRHGIRSAAGDISTEIAPGVHADAYEALLGGSWMNGDVIALTATDTASVNFPITADAARITLAGALTWGTYKVGATIVLAAPASPALNGMRLTITGIESTRIITARPLVPYTGALATPVVLTGGSIAAAGAIVQMGNIYRSFLFERAFADIGSFLLFKGMRFNTVAIDLPPTGIATANFGLLGLDAEPIRSASFDGVDELVLGPTELGPLTFDALTRTISAGTGSWATSGINVGDRVIFTGDGILDGQNRNPRTVVGLEDGTMLVAEAIQSGGPYSTDFAVTRVGLPDYTSAPVNEVLVAVSGVLMLNTLPVGTVTAASINIDNGMAGSNVVGKNVVPAILWGNQATVSGSLTVLFDRGGMGEVMYNAFDLEQELSLIVRLDTADSTNFVSFIMPRVKINSGAIGDAVAEGLPVTADFVALLPSGANDFKSTIVIQDSRVTAFEV